MCPPGVDQTTRSRQRWHILAASAQEKYDITSECAIHSSHNATVPTLLRGDFTWDAFEKLACRTSLDVCGLETEVAKLPYSTHTGSLSAIEALPDELLAMIFSETMLNISDVISFGLCSRMLWRHCLGHIRMSLSKGPWAWSSLVCTGSYLTDLPNSILRYNPSLAQDEIEWQARQSQPGQNISGKLGMCPARRWNWAAIGACKEVSTTKADQCLIALDALLSNLSAGIPSDDKNSLRRSLKHILAAGEPKPGSRWVLRNHSHLQYVRLKCAFNGAMEPQLYTEGLPWLTLDKMLLMRFSWTTPDLNHLYTPMLGRVLRGDWAGDQFDVVVAGDEGRAWSAYEYADVTAEILEEGRQWMPMSADLRSQDN